MSKMQCFNVRCCTFCEEAIALYLCTVSNLPEASARNKSLATLSVCLTCSSVCEIPHRAFQIQTVCGCLVQKSNTIPSRNFNSFKVLYITTVVKGRGSNTLV